MTNQSFNLELIPKGVPPIIHVSQYDKGQTWTITVTEDGIPFSIPAGTSVTVQGTKPDNTGFQYLGTADDSIVTFIVQQQMTVLAGEYDCELVLVNGNDQVATINFLLMVEAAALDDETIISETELPLIEQAAELGAVIAAYAQQIHADAETAASAVSTTAASETNAAASATAAASSASTATQAADDALASQTAAASSASAAATSESNAAASAAAAQAAIATDMTGATANADGEHGLVPQPLMGDEIKFLRGDGTWASVVIPPQSHVGMIIHSTTLDTEAKVIAQYGGNTWVQHSGYFLRGASSGVTANSATKTGGSDDAVVVAHTHTQSAHSHSPANGTNFGVYGAQGTNQFFFQGGTNNNGNFTGATSSVAPIIDEAGVDGTNRNIPNYKSVYIWERTA